MTLLQHLNELRKRLFYVALILTIGASIMLLFSRPLFELLQRPLLPLLPQDTGFIALTLMEGWLVYFKISVIAGVFVTSPFWLYQFWAFVAPGLVKREKRLASLAVVTSSLCFLLGGLFCYFVIMPYGFGYLVGLLADTGIQLMPQMNPYLSFALRLMLAFGIVFELPIVIVLLVRWDLVELKTLRDHRRHAIVFAFIFAAIITPPEVITQILMAIPFILLYETGLLVARVTRSKQAHIRVAEES